MVDYVVINHQSDSTELINLIKPNYYVKGPDYKKVAGRSSWKFIQRKKSSN